MILSRLIDELNGGDIYGTIKKWNRSQWLKQRPTRIATKMKFEMAIVTLFTCLAVKSVSSVVRIVY